MQSRNITLQLSHISSDSPAYFHEHEKEFRQKQRKELIHLTWQFMQIHWYIGDNKI